MRVISSYADIRRAFTDPTLGPPESAIAFYPEDMRQLPDDYSSSVTQGSKDSHREQRLQTARDFFASVKGNTELIEQMAQELCDEFEPTFDAVTAYAFPFTWRALEICSGIEVPRVPYPATLLAQAAKNSHDDLGRTVLHFLAGHDTLQDAISNGIATLIAHPDQVNLLYTNESLWPNAITELLRFNTPLHASPRTQDGDLVILDIESAHHDPEAFLSPQLFNIMRPDAETLAFGGGTFTCLGINAAKMLVGIALSTFINHFQHLPTITDSIPRETATQRGYRSLMLAK